VRIAALDVGTNTVRLLVADAEGGHVTDVERGRDITRLGQGVDATARLHPDAIVRTVDSIEGLVRRARDAGAVHVRIAGTSALRDAGDREAFSSLVLERTGIELEVLAGGEEGRLTYAGATSELGPGLFVVCDIGGGSTELCTRDDAVSLDVGSVRLKERFLHDDPPATGEARAARTFVDELLRNVAIPEGASLIGVAGTITTVAALVLGLHEYDSAVVHGSVLSRGDVAAMSERLLDSSAAQIVASGPVEPGRADVIGGGSLVLRAVMERWGFERVLVSERDILDGLVADLVQKLA
jgi:exopolyphosphatase/guanosine-5'-triphosphate,3'-diphosphate pyrophosphatase